MRKIVIDVKSDAKWGERHKRKINKVDERWKNEVINIIIQVKAICFNTFFVLYALFLIIKNILVMIFF